MRMGKSIETTHPVIPLFFLIRDFPMSVNNLMQNVFDYFLSLYHQDSDTPTGNSILAFQPIGTHITPKMFKLHSTDPSFSTNLAIEQFSSLTNVVPEISADVFESGFKTVEQSYDFLLEGSFPSPDSDNAALTLFSQFKAQAKKSFDEMKLGSMLKPITQFHPAYATPTDWYDTSSDSNWNVYSNETNTSISQKHTIEANWRWQVLSPELVPILAYPEVIDRISTINAADLNDVAIHPNTSQIDLSNVVLKPELETRLGEVLKFDLSSDTGQILKAELPLSRLSVSPMTVNTSLRRNVEGGIGIESRIPIMAQPTISVNRISLDRIPFNQIPADLSPKTDQDITPISSPVTQVARLRELLKQSTQQTVTSTNLKLSFKYCLVQIDRPWISQAYLETRHWYVPGHKSGSFSTGSFSPDPTEIFPVIPVAMILIKDLQITSWDETETDVIERSAGFGPFSFIGRTVDISTKTLSSSGVQVIGWVSQEMPLLPPDSDPTP